MKIQGFFLWKCRILYTLANTESRWCDTELGALDIVDLIFNTKFVQFTNLAHQLQQISAANLNAMPIELKLK